MADRARWAAALVRSCHPAPCAAVSTAAVCLAASSGRRAPAVVGVGAAVLAGQLGVGWHNDWFDAERDRRSGRLDKPAANDARLRSVVGAASAASLACCVPLSAISGRRAATAHLAGVGLALAYNVRLKATVWSWVPYAGGFSLLVAFVDLGRPDRRPPAWWALTAGGLLGVGAHFADVIPDLEGDAATGVRGLPNRLGRRGATICAVGLVLAASGLVALRRGRPRWPTAGLPAAVTALGAGAVTERRRPGSLFRAILGVALLDVAMLVVRGGSP